MDKVTDNTAIPLEHKFSMSIEEAAKYTGIGVGKLREMSAEKDCPFVLWVGARRLIKREAFEDYLRRSYSI